MSCTAILRCVQPYPGEASSSKNLANEPRPTFEDRVATALHRMVGSTLLGKDNELKIMAANEATRLRSEHAEPRAEEGSAARPLIREPSSAEAAHSEASEAEADSADPGSEALAALERAAENIRPSWHGAELPPAPTESGAIHASLPAALPPPPALPAFSSFPIEQAAPYYRVDTTVRTAAILPERLAQLLRQPHFARARNRALRQIADASHWLRARPWARGSLAAVAVLLLAWLLWPSAPEAAQTTAKPKPASSAPVVPAARAAQEPPPAAASEAVAAKPRDPEPPVVSVKKRDKRKAAIGKTAVGKAAPLKAATADVAAVKPGAAKTRKPARAAATPAR